MTLSELDKARELLKYRESLHKSFADLKRMTSFQYKSAELNLATMEVMDRDIAMMDGLIKESTLAIDMAKKAWEVCDAHIKIYNLEAYQIFNYLTGQILEGHLEHNHFQGLEALKRTVANFQSIIQSARDAIHREQHEHDNDPYYMGGLGGGMGSRVGDYEREIAATQPKLDKQVAIYNQAEAEWTKIREIVKEKNLTSDQYLVVVKAVIERFK